MTENKQLKHHQSSEMLCRMLSMKLVLVSIDTLQSAEAIDMAIMIVLMSLACPCSHCDLKI